MFKSFGRWINGLSLPASLAFMVGTTLAAGLSMSLAVTLSGKPEAAGFAFIVAAAAYMGVVWQSLAP
jgi:hypothetical protein